MIEYEGFKIVVDENWGTMFRVKPAGKGGSIPTVLAGLYSTTDLAQKGIDTYRSTHKEKVKSNATKLSVG